MKALRVPITVEFGDQKERVQQTEVRVPVADDETAKKAARGLFEASSRKTLPRFVRFSPRAWYPKDSVRKTRTRWSSSSKPSSYFASSRSASRSQILKPSRLSYQSRSNENEAHNEKICAPSSDRCTDMRTDGASAAEFDAIVFGTRRVPNTAGRHPVNTHTWHERPPASTIVGAAVFLSAVAGTGRGTGYGVNCAFDAP